MKSIKGIDRHYFHIRNEIMVRERSALTALWAALAFAAVMIAAFAVEYSGALIKASQVKLMILSVFPVVSVVVMYQFSSQARALALLHGQAAAIEAVLISSQTEHYSLIYSQYYCTSDFMTFRLPTGLMLPYLLCADALAFWLLFSLCTTMWEYVIVTALLFSVVIGFAVMVTDNMRNKKIKEEIQESYTRKYRIITAG